MKNYRIFAATCMLAAGLAISAGTARAQVAEGLVAAPVVVRTIGKIKPKGTPAGMTWMKAEVILANTNSIVVREQGNGMTIHTFNFTPELRDKMQAILDKGGYQYGDKVNILYPLGQTVAVRIHGKPSKPL